MSGQGLVDHSCAGSVMAASKPAPASAAGGGARSPSQRFGWCADWLVTCLRRGRPGARGAAAGSVCMNRPAGRQPSLASEQIHDQRVLRHTAGSQSTELSRRSSFSRRRWALGVQKGDSDLPRRCRLRKRGCRACCLLCDEGAALSRPTDVHRAAARHRVAFSSRRDDDLGALQQSQRVPTIVAAILSKRRRPLSFPHDVRTRAMMEDGIVEYRSSRWRCRPSNDCAAAVGLLALTNTRRWFVFGGSSPPCLSNSVVTRSPYDC